MNVNLNIIANVLGQLWIIVGSVLMVKFACNFPFTTKIKELQYTDERLYGMNGQEVWSVAWESIIIGACYQIFALFL